MDSYRYVIAGGGMVAGYAAKELVANGLGPGQLAILSGDDALPYERPPLSKGFLAGSETESSVFINDAAFYDQHGITVRLRCHAERLDTGARRITLHDGSDVGYERLLVATGSAPRHFTVPGAEAQGIHVLRSLDDSKQLRDASRAGRRAVVAGAGFIGMEVSAVLAARGLATTLVFPEERVWRRFFTPEMSAFFEKYYRDHGVQIAPGETITGFEGHGAVDRVLLASGRTLPADLVVAGIGVVPATDWLKGSGLELDNGVVVDEYLRTGVDGVYAAGDIAHYWDVLFAKRRRVEHWDNAVEQGKHAARQLLGANEPFVHLPYFFSDVFDLSYEYWGDSAGADSVSYRGDVASSSFSAWWSKDGRVVAAFVMGREDEERDLAQRLITDKRPLAMVPGA